ncbi:putative membrane protein [Helicobacter pylori Hp M3]|nr:putative membrane protein [Helicobacter pylori Hp M3]
MGFGRWVLFFKPYLYLILYFLLVLFLIFDFLLVVGVGGFNLIMIECI